MPRLIPHDLRRTAVRNLERAGVARSAVMKMVRHKTESIYRRYAIADSKVLEEAAIKLAALQSKRSSRDAEGRDGVITMSRDIPALPEDTTYAQFQELIASIRRKFADYARAHQIESDHDAHELASVVVADDARVLRSLLDEREQAAFYVHQFSERLEADLTSIDPATGKPRGRLDHYDELGWPIWVPND